MSVLEQAVATVVRRHEVLCSRIAEKNGRAVLVPAEPDEPVPLVIRDVSAASDPEAEATALIRAESRRPFDLARDLPVRVLMTRTADENALALILEIGRASCRERVCQYV